MLPSILLSTFLLPLILANPLPLAPLTLDLAVRDSTSAAATSIEYWTCDGTIEGSVQNITISPCEGGNGTEGSPCQFTRGENYTITVTYTPFESATTPRANLIAYDSTETYGGDHYPYSGQSFNGCVYTACPIVPNEIATYTYKFRTLNSQFDSLAFNLTTSLTGPSILCAGFPIDFVSS